MRGRWSWESLGWYFLAIYAFGCAVSQSLMSLCGTLGVVAAAFLVMRHWRTLARAERLAVIAFAVWAIFSLANVLARPWDERSGRACGRILLFGLPLLAMGMRPSEKFSANPLTGINAAALLGLTASLLLGAQQYFVDHIYAGAFMGNVNYLAYNLLPTMVFWSEQSVAKDSHLARERKMSAAGACLSALGIFLSLARTVTAVAMLYLFRRATLPIKNHLGRRRFAILAAVILAVGAGAYLSSPIAQEKIHRSFSGKDPSWTWRKVAWAENLRLFRESPWIGVGYERNGIDVEKRVDLRGHWQPSHLIFAHSIYLQTLAESGLVGALLLLVYFVLLLLRCPALGPIFVVTALGGITENVFNNSKSLHPFLFYTLLTLWIHRRHSPESPSSRGAN